MPALCLLIPLLLAVLATLVLAGVADGGWPGVAGASATKFCEVFRPGLVAQPANTWSNLGFVAVGLGIGLVAVRDRRSPGQNRMNGTGFFPTFYASVAVLLGPGSAAMHASTTRWGGTVDVLSMFLWVSWVIAYGLARLRGFGPRGFLALYVPLAGLLGALLVGRRLPVGSDEVFGALIAAFAAIELTLALRRPAVRMDRRHLAAASALFALAFGIWLPSQTGGPWCAPESWIQGHAAWHLLCAGSVGFIYLYYRSERGGEWSPAPARSAAP